MGYGDLRGEVDEQVDMLTLAIELNQLTLEVRTHFVEDSFQRAQVRVLEHPVPVLGHENQVDVE